MSEVYEFLYCGCIHESSYATMSLHRTKEGAERAMNEHKEKAYKKWEELCVRWRSDHDMTEDMIPKFGEHEDWSVNPITIQD